MPYPKDQSSAVAAPAPTRSSNPRPRAAPAPYSPPPAPPVTSNSGGQYSGGGAPKSTPDGNRMGAQGGVGRQGAINRRGGFNAERGKGGGRQQGNPVQGPTNGNAPAENGLQSFLAGDEVFQSSMRDLKGEMQDYRTSNKGQRRDVREDFDLAGSRMGDERTNALEQMMNDFAARGLLNSSEYLDAQSDYNTSFDNKLGDMTRDRDRNLTDLLESLGMYKRTNKGERQNAKQEAVRRRAEQMGLTG